jgi:hypothetical protein
MRDFIFIIAALTAFISVGCSGDETIEAPEKKAISFENAFVDKRTRTEAEDPSTTKDNITGFTVYGYQGEKVLFDGTSVTKVTADDNSVSWTYSPVKYWVASATYNFVALANVTDPTVAINSDTKAITTDISSFTSTGIADPLVSSQVSSTGATSDGTVQFTFKHLLAKVKFTFENAFGSNDDVTLQVKNVKITDAYKTGSAKVVGGTSTTITWSNQATDSSETGFSLDFGETGKINPPAQGATANNSDETTYAKLLIPSAASKSYTIKFDIDVIANAGTDNELVTATYSKEVEVSNQALEAGKSYNFQAVLNANNVSDTELKPITFAINEVAAWEDGGSVTVPTPKE